MAKLQIIFDRVLWYIKFISNCKSRYKLHSPFFYRFAVDILYDDSHYYAFDQIEAWRKSMLNNHKTIDIDDHGAGSQNSESKKRKISSIASSAAIPPKEGKWLFKIAMKYQPETMLELGTSLGIASQYLASGHSTGKLYTIEGDSSIAELAQLGFEQNGIENVELLQGTFQEHLGNLLADLPPIDLAFIDGDHKKDSTLEYFEMILGHAAPYCMIIFDDIRWNRDMYNAWQLISSDSRIQGSIDLFTKGIVILDPDIYEAQHEVLCRNG